MKKSSEVSKPNNLELVSITHEEKRFNRIKTLIENENLFPEVTEKNFLEYMQNGLNCYLSPITQYPAHLTMTTAFYYYYGTLQAGLPLALAYILGPLSGAFDWATREQVNREQYIRCFYKLTLFDTNSRRKDFIEAVLQQYHERSFIFHQSKSSKALIQDLSNIHLRITVKWEKLLEYMFKNIKKNNGKTLSCIIHDLADNFYINKFKYKNLSLFFKSEEAESLPQDVLNLIIQKYIGVNSL